MNAKQRFSNRVDDYVNYRPDYPHKCAEFVLRTFALDENAVIADVGSGTGKFSKLFDGRKGRIFGIEPNHEMREASQILLKEQKNFQAIDGDAEATTLGTASVDAVVCAQSFHWFDRNKTRAEFSRILKGKAPVALVWNRRRDDTPFLREYEALLRAYANDYAEVTHHDLVEEDFRNFFTNYRIERLPNWQRFDFPSLCGRARSSSYCPLLGEPNHAALLRELETLFEKYQENGVITFEYQTELYLGWLRS